jgi:hypothetical protein
MSAGEAALKVTVRLWFLTAVIGQCVFFYYIAAFYGPSTFQANFQAWTKNTYLFKGYVAGDTVGNLFFAAHALLAAVIAFGGTQLVAVVHGTETGVHVVLRFIKPLIERKSVLGLDNAVTRALRVGILDEGRAVKARGRFGWRRWCSWLRRRSSRRYHHLQADKSDKNNCGSAHHDVRPLGN